MIKFFRKIRQKLLSENKFSKYLLYAIGEIILVVVGILIALQINNNNELRKTREFEVKMLNEIRHELIQDTIYFNIIRNRAEKALQGAKKMMLLYTQESPQPDSLSKYGQMMSVSFQYIYHKGAYEAIKSTGIDKISNDSIRLMITDMYDFRMPRAKNFIENEKDKSMSDMEYLSHFVNFDIIKSPNGEAIPYIKPKTSIAGNKVVAELIFEKMAKNGEAVGRLENLTQACERLLKLLDRELKIDKK